MSYQTACEMMTTAYAAAAVALKRGDDRTAAVLGAIGDAWRAVVAGMAIDVAEVVS